MPSCAVRSCKNRTGNKKSVEPGVKYFSFPRDEKMVEKWVEGCDYPNVNIKHGTVCSIHLEESCFEKDWRNKVMNYSPVKCRKIKPDAIPTLFLRMPVTKRINQERPKKIDSTDQMHKIEMDSMSCSLLSESPDTKENCSPQKKEAEVEESPNVATSSTSTTEIASCSRDICEFPRKDSQQETELEAMREKIQAMEKEVINLKRKLKEVEPHVKEMTERLCVSFPKGTVRRMLHPSLKHVKWSPKDIALAISMRSITLKGYNYFRTKRQIPLPAPSTLRRWISNVDFEESNRYGTKL